MPTPPPAWLIFATPLLKNQFSKLKWRFHILTFGRIANFRFFGRGGGKMEIYFELFFGHFFGFVFVFFSLKIE